MDTDKNVLVESDLTESVIGAFFSAYKELGSGFLESVYENALALVLRNAGLNVLQQASLVVKFRGQIIGEFRADLLIEGKLLIEVKAASQLTAAHEAQLLNYLKATGTRVGLILNFGPRAEYKRRIFGFS